MKRLPRFTFTPKPETRQQIDELKDRTATEHTSDVICRAITLYHWYRRAKKPGAKIWIEQPDGKIVEFVFVE